MASGFRISDTEEVVINSLDDFMALSDFEAMDRNYAAMAVIIRSACDKYLNRGAVDHPTNGDEKLTKKIGNYSKGLPHNSIGEVDLNAYSSFYTAMTQGAAHPELFDRIVLGGVRKLVNPQNGLTFNIVGPDPQSLVMDPPPSVLSDEAMGELIENYWMSVCRDVPFAEYDTNPLTIAAAADLSNRRVFNGPKVGGLVTTATLFRASFEGCLVGPYMSQFMYLPTPFGSTSISQLQKTYVPNVNYMQDFTNFLRIQNGLLPTQTQQYDSVLRMIRNGRDLAAYVAVDVLYQAYQNAALILMTKPSASSQMAGIGAPLSPNNPYASGTDAAATQVGFGAFGDSHLMEAFVSVCTASLGCCWFQKWQVHRRLRPEAMGGLLYNEVNGIASYGLSDDYLTSTVFTENGGNYLLDQAYNNGSPLHPSAPPGHCIVAFACITILKCWFRPDFVIRNPVVCTDDGLDLQPYVGPPLTVIGELHKLAVNISLGRDFAGVHFRSELIPGALLGEEVAIQVLRDQANCYNESFSGWKLTKLDGSVITIGKNN